MRSAASRTRVRRTVPLSRRLSSGAKTGGSNPSRRHWASASAMSPGVVAGASDGSGVSREALVALLGDGQRHQPRGRCGHCVERGGHPGLHGGQRADHLERGVFAGLPHGDGEEPVLWLELFLRPPAPDGDAPDQRGPAKAEERVGVDGEVGPGERSETEVGDARSGGTVVVRQGGRPCLVQRAGAQPLPFADRHSSPRQRQDAV